MSSQLRDLHWVVTLRVQETGATTGELRTGLETTFR